MQLAPMRYTRIEGTAVAVSVKSAAEAKAAVKELRNKKRELKFLKSALLRRRRAAARRPGSGSRTRRSRSLFLRALIAMGAMVGALIERLPLPRQERRTREPAEIERELHRLDETLHNIDGCILQLQGKLLARG